MKELIKVLSTIIGAGIGGAIPIWGAITFWMWCMAQVPVTMAYAGLIKVGITLLLIAVGGGLTFAIAFLGAMLAGTLVAACVGFLD